MKKIIAEQMNNTGSFVIPSIQQSNEKSEEALNPQEPSEPPVIMIIMGSIFAIGILLFSIW